MRSLRSPASGKALATWLRGETMPRWSVTVRYEQEKEITVYARDENAAIEKAVEIVEGWNGVLSAEADEAEEIE